MRNVGVSERGASRIIIAESREVSSISTVASLTTHEDESRDGEGDRDSDGIKLTAPL